MIPGNWLLLPGTGLWWGGRGRRGKWGEMLIQWKSCPLVAGGAWINGSSPSFPSCSPGSRAGVISSCIRNQDSLEQFMLPNPHWQSRPNPNPLCIWRAVAHLTIAQRETRELCTNEPNPPSIDATWSEPFDDSQTRLRGFTGTSPSSRTHTRYFSVYGSTSGFGKELMWT